MSDTRWVAWTTDATVYRLEEWINRHHMQTTAMDLAMASPEKYASLAHLTPEGVGGYADQGAGEPGRAACGVEVPPDNPSAVRLWYIEDGRGGIGAIRKCKRCLAGAKRT